MGILYIFCISSIGLNFSSNILKPSSYRPFYILTLVQKVKHRVYKIHAFLNEAILCESLQVISFKMKCTSCTDEVRERVPSFQKSHFFYDINHNTEPLLIYIFVCLKMVLATVI